MVAAAGELVVDPSTTIEAYATKWSGQIWTPEAAATPNLQAHGPDYLLSPERRTDPIWLSTVVWVAQDLGVFGAAGYRISLDLADPPGQPGGAVGVGVASARPATVDGRICGVGQPRWPNATVPLPEPRWPPS
jgi:hypothetical protein